MSVASRIARFVLLGLIVPATLIVIAGCASSRPAGSQASLAEVNEAVTGEDVQMYAQGRASPQTVSGVTLSADSIYYVDGTSGGSRRGRTAERSLQQQPLSAVDSLQVESGGMRGGVIGFSIGAIPGLGLMLNGQAEERRCQSIGCSFNSGYQQTGGALLMVLGGLVGALLGRSAGKKSETVYRASEFSAVTSPANASSPDAISQNEMNGSAREALVP